VTRPDPVVRATLACLRRPGRVLAGAILLGAAALLLAARLELRTSIAELLPTDDPAVQGLLRTKSRVSDLSLLVIGSSRPTGRRTCATPPP
jgi:hypothetical protein